VVALAAAGAVVAGFVGALRAFQDDVLAPALAKIPGVGEDGETERDRNAAQAHHRRRHAEETHRHEGEEHDERERDERHERAAEVHEEQEHDVDESELLEPEEKGFFSPGSRAAPDDDRGIEVRVSREPAVKWDRRTARVRFVAAPGALSAPVWVGLLSVVGLAMQTGVLMIVYIDDAYERRVREGRMRSREDIVEAHAEGTVLRLRPKIMTITTMGACLLPLLWADGAGSEIMRRVAAPMIGGLVTSAFLTLEVLPVLYTIWRVRELQASRQRAPAPSASPAE
jgi:hypothetical protein